MFFFVLMDAGTTHTPCLDAFVPNSDSYQHWGVAGGSATRAEHGEASVADLAVKPPAGQANWKVP